MLLLVLENLIRTYQSKKQSAVKKSSRTSKYSLGFQQANQAVAQVIVRQERVFECKCEFRTKSARVVEREEVTGIYSFF